MLKLKNSISDFDKLRELLLSDEIEQLKQLESKLESIEFDLHNKADIVERITPLFDQIFLERLQHKDEETQKILADHLAKVITLSSKKDIDTLSYSLQSVISPAISKEIANNKDTMIDALYPIMGGMISKYVSEAIKEFIETINNKIDDGLSMDRYKRKIKSKITGVSESELLLQESTEALISSLFVIQKESGLLISEAHLVDQKIDDSHMVASMASAIKDFINDWISTREDEGEVQILSYGKATLYIESAGSVYLIAFLDAVPDQELKSEINAFFAKLVQEYAELFQTFDGDDSTPDIHELTLAMESYLYGQDGVTQRDRSSGAKKPMKYIMVVVGLFIMVWLGYYGKNEYFEYTLEREVHEKTGYAIKVENSAEDIKITGRVNSFEDAKSINYTVAEKTNKSITNHLAMELESIYQVIDSAGKKNGQNMEAFSKVIDQYKEEIRSLQEVVNNSNKTYQHQVNEVTEKVNKLEEKINQLEEKNEKIHQITQIKESILNRVSQEFIENPKFDRKSASLDFSAKNLFLSGTVESNDKAKELIKKSFQKYLELLDAEPSVYKYIKHIVIEGHSDSTGEEHSNMEISKQRAESVKNYLMTLEFAHQYKLQGVLRSVGVGSTQPVMKNGLEDKDASRRISVKLIIDEGKILDHIKELTND